ncbi:heterokaryon incompatibility protein-domain-containing protein [Cubamyces lactineus]|nr:heterokaryon incompatibility protein-domain-containing protein [Cubamyces lactineus]
MALPPRPHNICTLAWEGVFAARFGYWDEPVRCVDEDDDEPQCWTGGYTYTVSSAVWLTCAHTGCSWCRFLEKRFLKKIKSWYSVWPIRDKPVDVRVGRNESLSCIGPRGNLSMDWCHIILKYGERAYSSVFVLNTYADDHAAPYVGNVLSVPYVWMEECAQGHEVCRRLGTLDSANWLPTRLVDCSNPHRVRVIETKDIVNGARYVALSYVWGAGSQTHRTTTANLPTRLRDGIATEALPRTIRDAIYVTRTLGFGLLWLDSLCIIQDSPEDKHREVGSMARVYRHAYLTIDAATAAGVKEGFLQDRPPAHPPNATILPFICPASSGDGQVLQPETEVRVGCVYFSTGYERREDCRLKNETDRRGWCLQERLLSTRSLIFDRKTLSVKCQTRPAPRPIGVDGGLRNNHGLYDVIPIPGPASAVLPGSEKWEKIYERWQDIVEDYSGRSLTYASDKLLACAAIAEAFAPHLGPGYLAGLWPQTLLRDLLWHTWGDSPGRPWRYPYAPSWSWASTNRRSLARYNPWFK